MAEYNVTWVQTLKETFTVEAESEEEAIEIVENNYDVDMIDSNEFYIERDYVLNKSSNQTETYSVGYKGYKVDIVTTKNSYEAWLYCGLYSIKSLMFGVPKEQQSKEKFLNIVKANLNEYIDIYEKEVK